MLALFGRYIYDIMQGDFGVAPINRRCVICLIHLNGSPLDVPHLPKKKQKLPKTTHQPSFIFLPNPICPQRIFGAKLIEKMPTGIKGRGNGRVGNTALPLLRAQPLFLL